LPIYRRPTAALGYRRKAEVIAPCVAALSLGKTTNCKLTVEDSCLATSIDEHGLAGFAPRGSTIPPLIR
jgi:hypothetical protein